MLIRRLPSLLLVLALCLGQWLVLVHFTEHELGANQATASCELCAFAHGPGPLPAAPQSLHLARLRHERPLDESIHLLAAQPCPLPHSRGPPAVLA